MIPIRYFLSALMLCLLAGAGRIQAQCTSDAGTITLPLTTTCEGADFSVIHNGNMNLDANDILVYVAFKGASPNAGNVLATSANGNFTYQGGFLANSPIQIAAVVGNDLGGTVDWDDPCLSISPAFDLEIAPTPPLTVSPSGILTCAQSTVTVTASSSQQNLSYAWSTGETTAAITVPQPGLYSVTVTNQFGCSAQGNTTVFQNFNVVQPDAGPDQVLTCAQPTITLTISNLGPTYTFLWWGPNGFASTQLNPTISQPGTYTLVVTNTANGCTATDNVNVTADVAVPLASAGPDVGIPCGGGTATLEGSATPAGSSFLWTGPGGFANTSQNPFVSGSGTYTLIVTAPNGCTATDVVNVFPGPVIDPQNFSVTQPGCGGDNDGAIELTTLPAGGQAPFDFAWSGPNNYISNAEDIQGIIAGTYTLAATDATGCTFYAMVNVAQPQPVSLITTSLVVQNVSCNGGSNGAISFNVTGGTQPYSYSWTPMFPNTNSLTNLLPGIYSVTVTDANSCTAALQPFTITQPAPLAITFTNAITSCNTIDVTATVGGIVQPVQFIWSTGVGGTASGSYTTEFTQSGTYTLTVTTANGCTQVSTINITVDASICGYLNGSVMHDLSEDCIADIGEPGLSGWLVKAEDISGNTFYGTTDNAGNYLIGVPLGSYEVSAITPNSLWLLCGPGPATLVPVAGDTFFAGNIPVKKLAGCQQLTVSIGTGTLRRCFSNNYYYVNYCNEGTALAENAFVLITLDPFMTPLSASKPYTNLGNNVLRFELGDLDIGDCGNFYLQVQISCSAVLGQTHCTEAHIYPDSTCLPPNPLWSGAELKLNSQCDADSVRFFLENIGANDMNGAVDYIVIEESVMLMQGSVQLDAGESLTLPFPANGSTWRVEVGQVPFFPGLSVPALSVEGCTQGSVFSTGFLTQFSVNDADPWVDIDCTQNIGSYDPNDKQAFPEGYGAAHYIRPGTELEYLIRFQNTGTDTAFTVRIVDTLSTWLDPTSIKPGASSHHYQFDLTGAGIATFLFENILLPDSNVNQAGSNGFVKFSIHPRVDAPLETVIENDAAIYFDFNDPVITNTVFHRLGENFVVGTWQPHQPGAEVSISPNPFGDWTTLAIKGLKKDGRLRLQVFDLQGVLVREQASGSAVFQLERGDWQAGVYLFSITQDGKSVGSGKLIVH